MAPDLLLTLLGLALLDSLSPTTILISIIALLARGRRAWPLLLIYWGTTALLYFALGAVLMLSFGAAFAIIDDTIGLWIQAAIGAVMLVGSFFIKPGRTRQPSSRLSAMTHGGMVILGIGTWGIEAATAVPYFGATALMSSAEVPAVQWVLALLGYVVVMMLPAILLATLWIFLGQRMSSTLERLRDKLRTGSTSAVGWVIAIAGFLVLRDAAWRLASTYNLLGDIPGI